jgi:hypothetical protein
VIRIEVAQGDSFERVFMWRNAGQPIDFEGVKAVATLQDSVTGEMAAFCTVGDGITIDAENSDVYVYFKVAKTYRLEINRSYYLHVQIRYPDGTHQTTQTINVMIKRGV